jgi:hypothetical protein
MNQRFGTVSAEERFMESTVAEGQKGKNSQQDENVAGLNQEICDHFVIWLERCAKMEKARWRSLEASHMAR